MFTIPDQDVLAQYIGKTLYDASEVIGEIYKMTCKTSGKSYIGQTVSHAKNRKKWRPTGYVRRTSAHFCEAKHDQRGFECTYLNNAIRKYGDDDFDIELIMRCPRDDMHAWEIHWIDKLGTLAPDGYNLTIGGKVLVRETVKKEGKDKVFLKTPRNAPKTPEAIAKWSASSRAFYATPEGHKSMSDRVQKYKMEKSVKKFENEDVSSKDDSYIRHSKNMSTGEIDGCVIYFSNTKRVVYKKMGLDEALRRAHLFLEQLREHQANIKNNQIATLSN